ncbi:MAG: hypothetical protein RLO18_28285, partial [Gimesia chilikensis]
DWSRGGLFKFHWAKTNRYSLKIYTLSLPQALVVQQLLQAYADGKPDVAESALLKVAAENNKAEPPKTLAAIFNNGQHPAWKSLIIPGKTTGTWRLTEQQLNQPVQSMGGGGLGGGFGSSVTNPFGGGTFENNRTQSQQQAFPGHKSGTQSSLLQQPVQASKPRAARTPYKTVVLFGKDPGMSNDLAPLKNDSGTRIMKRVQRGASTFEVTPGEYAVTVSTQLVGWATNGRSARYVDSELNVNTDQSVEKTLHYNFQKLAENHPIWKADEHFYFHWPNPKQGVGMEFDFSAQQAKVVQELLQGFADGKPDVPETTLLKIFGNVIELDKSSNSQLKSLEEIFSDIKQPDWKQLIVPGKTEKTWRLVDPEFQQRQQAKSQTTEKSSEPVGGGVK